MKRFFFGVALMILSFAFAAVQIAACAGLALGVVWVVGKVWPVLWIYIPATPKDLFIIFCIMRVAWNFIYYGIIQPEET